MRFLVLFVCAVFTTANAYEITGYVDRVSDGDTFLIITDTGIPQRIRMLHIDSPERGNPYYKKSKLMLSELIEKKTVTAECTWLDSFNRHLCEAYLDDLNINREMIARGGAWLHVKYYNREKDKANLVDVETTAKARKQGLWGISEYQYILPWEYKK